MEGLEPYEGRPDGAEEPADHAEPIHVYPIFGEPACAITGGYVYRGSAIPQLQGVYFYGDFCQGWVRSFRYSSGAVTELTEWPSLRPGGSITSFGRTRGTGRGRTLS
jgi:hypothetical protein